MNFLAFKYKYWGPKNVYSVLILFNFFPYFLLSSFMIGTIFLFPGTVFSVSVLSHRMEINDLLISISVCCFYIAAAVCYIFAGQFFQIFMSKY